jgi:hypothetical protein
MLAGWDFAVREVPQLYINSKRNYRESIFGRRNWCVNRHAIFLDWMCSREEVLMGGPLAS